MARVASYSVWKGLEVSYGGPTYHAHSMKGGNGIEIGGSGGAVQDLHLKLKDTEFKLISLVRNPIDRNISYFFLPGTIAKYGGNHQMSVEQLQEIFINEFDHDFALNWFDDEIKQYFGIDVYSIPFSDSGIQLYEPNLLVIQSEIEDQHKIKAIRDFLNTPGFALGPGNRSSAFAYAEIYAKFKEEAKFPEDYLDKMCNSKYFRYFYDEEYIKSVRQKWTK
jgi:hypothetical protein